MNKPKISIVTVVYNGIDYIEPTILSVVNQDYPNFEYIIIDGGSSDGTVEVIKQYESKLSYWISEKDAGIYDAMNKGIDRASGDWIIFMNCGDYFYDPKVISQIFNEKISDDISMLIGGAFIRSAWGDFFIKARPENEIWKSFTHQSIFSRAHLNRKYKFNLDFKAASDFDFVYNLFSKKYKTKSLDITVSNILYVSSGFSSVNELCSKKEVLNSIVLHKSDGDNFVKHYLYHLNAYVRKYISIIIRNRFPKVIHYIRKKRDLV
ncbi:glycosyltransferase family 2 protein [Flavobacterium sp.]|uniref:glycosyltransferase family 2 protein n=1 Tax=Flavobacterium sp. TaxID=239 RepID=UPI002EDAADC9